MGNYITLEVDGIIDTTKETKKQNSKGVIPRAKRLIPFHDKLKVLVIGLGNE